ncbi:RDD family protein [Roseburia hominis]
MQNNYANRAEEYTYAGFWARLAAFLIDNIIVFFMLLIVRMFLGLGALLFSEFAGAGSTFFNKGLLFQFSLKDILLYLVKVAYFIILTYYTGCTFGKRAMNLVVISRKTSDGRVSLFDIIYRETIGRYLSSFLLCIGYFMIGIGKEKCGIHDILCDTRVVYGKKLKLFETNTAHRQTGTFSNTGNMNPPVMPAGPYSYTGPSTKDNQSSDKPHFNNTAPNRPNQPFYGAGPYQYGVPMQNAPYEPNTSNTQNSEAFNEEECVSEPECPENKIQD